MQITTNNEFKLYSLNTARKLLGIGRSTLGKYINAGMIGVIQHSKNRVKIPQQELQRFIDENINRERKQSLLSPTEKTDVTSFISGSKAECEIQLDSVGIFNKLMEKKKHG